MATAKSASETADRADASVKNADALDAGPGGAWFTDVTEKLGIKNPKGPWPDGRYLTPEITPGGVALFDANGDGRLDILQICHCAPGSFTEKSPCRLWLQQSDGTFKEVPGAMGLDNDGYGHGVAIGDIDNDGHPDVYISNYGQDHLYVYKDGKYVDRTKQAGIAQEFHWGSSCGFLDYDRDGYLDLFVARFAKFDETRICQAGNNPNDRDYCGPHTFQGELHALYHNNGDGTFTEVTAQAGIDKAARGWGVVCADLNGDGWCDIYVANDEEPAQLWINQHDGTFKEEATVRGCAYNNNGRVEAGMGLAVGDVNGDGKLDLFKTHITSETNTLYVATKDYNFSDKTASAGMGAVDRPFTGWGTGFVDFNHDGFLDVAVVNGRVAKGFVWPKASLGKFWNQFAEPKLLFMNDGLGHFKDASAQTGDWGSRPEVTRGIAFGDIDGDGDIDMVTCNLDNTLRIFRNDVPKQGNHWLIVRAMTGKRDANGAMITAIAGDKKFLRLASPVYSFLSSSDPRAHFGLGKIDKLDGLLVAWPSGAKERFPVPGIDRVITIQEGHGKAAE